MADELDIRLANAEARRVLQATGSRIVLQSVVWDHFNRLGIDMTLFDKVQTIPVDRRSIYITRES